MSGFSARLHRAVRSSRNHDVTARHRQQTAASQSTCDPIELFQFSAVESSAPQRQACSFHSRGCRILGIRPQSRPAWPKSHWNVAAYSYRPYGCQRSASAAAQQCSVHYDWVNEPTHGERQRSSCWCAPPGRHICRPAAWRGGPWVSYSDRAATERRMGRPPRRRRSSWLSTPSGSADQYIRPGRRGRGFTRRRGVRYIDHWTAMPVQYRETGMVAALATAAGSSC